MAKTVFKNNSGIKVLRAQISSLPETHTATGISDPDAQSSPGTPVAIGIGGKFNFCISRLGPYFLPSSCLYSETLANCAAIAFGQTFWGTGSSLYTHEILFWMNI